MLILGIDPGSAIIGYGLIETSSSASQRGQKECLVKKYGCLFTRPKQTAASRLNDLHRQLDKLIKQSRPNAVAVEELFFFKNQKTVIQVSQARGVILLTAQKNKVTVYEYTPLQVKQALTGYGRAEKKQIQQMVKMVLGLKEIPKPDDAADALAVAICCAHSIKTEDFINRRLVG